MICFTENQAARVRGAYDAGLLDPVRVVPGLYQLPDRLIEVFPDAELDQYPTTDDLLATAKAHMKAQAAAIRWGKCQLMSYDGETAAYADAAIAVTTAKIRALEESGSTDPVNFKLTATAWRSWTLTDLKAYGAAIDTHIQACFDNEAALAGQIEAAVNLDALRAIDLDAGWP
jgi:hypothetical protein